MAKLVILFFTAFVDMVGLAMVLPLIPYYATSLGVNGAMVGVLVSAFALAQLVSAPAWGRFSDRCGRKPAILLGLAITAIGFMIFAVADSVLLLFLSRIVQGVGGGTIPVVQAYVADASPSAVRTKNLAWLSTVRNLGAVVGPAIGSVLVAAAGRSAPGYAAAALAAVLAAFAWRFLRETEPHGATTEYPTHLPSSTQPPLVTILTRWGDPVPRLIWTYTLSIGAYYGTILTMPLLLSARLGIAEHSVGYTIMYLCGVGVLVRTFLLGRLVDRFGEARLSRIGVPLLAGGLALVGATSDYPTLVAALTVVPLGAAFLFPCVTGQLSRLVSHRERGLYMGLQHTFGGVSQVVFPIAAGFLMDHVGLGVPFFTAGAVVLATLLLPRHLEVPRGSPAVGAVPDRLIGLDAKTTLA